MCKLKCMNIDKILKKKKQGLAVGIGQFVEIMGSNLVMNVLCTYYHLNMRIT